MNAIRKAAVAVIALQSQIAAADDLWVNIGRTESGVLLLDKQNIRNTKYLRTKPGELNAELMSYREVWVKNVDPAGNTLVQSLWIFDCAGRAGQIAFVETNPPKSWDATTQARASGAERYMMAIPPGSFYEAGQTVVCAPHQNSN